MKKGLLMLSGLVLSAGWLFAQPTNDKCADATPLVIYNSEAEAVLVEGDSRNATDGALDSIPVCSGNFYRDDVWFSITAPAEFNETGYAIQLYFNESGIDMSAVGYAFYTSCEGVAENTPTFCGNNPENGKVFTCLDPEQTIYIRVWSAEGDAVNWQDGWGTFRIAAFVNDYDHTPGANVLWGNQPGEGDFNGGLNGWVAEGIACNGGQPAENALWTWTAEALPFWIFGPEPNEDYIRPVASRTVCNGAVIFDSALLEFGTVGTAGAGDCPWMNHEGTLTSPSIDLSGFNVAGVTLVFNQSMERWREGLHFVAYSLDGGQNWTETEINNEKTYLSTDPTTGKGYYNEDFRLPLAGAAGASDLKIRFRFMGGAYWWVIDDVRIEEREANNLRLDERFVTYQLPIQGVVGQGIPWMPQVDLLNIGARDQTNVVLNARVVNPLGETVYNENLELGTLQVDSSAVNENSTIMVPFDIATAPGTYTITYTVSSDSVDFNPLDDTIVYQAYVDQNTFATEIGPTTNITGAPGNWDDGAPHSFIYGNYYHTPAGSLRKFVSGSFGLGNIDELQGVPIDFVLFKWLGGLENEICEGGERELAGFATYVPEAGDGGADGDTIIDIEFENFFNPGQPILLEDNTSYILAIQWNSPGDNGDLFVLSATEVDYGQTIQQLVQFGTPHFAGMLVTPDDGINEGVAIGTTTFNDGRSARSVVPVARMNTDLIISVKDPLPAINVVKLYPNPVQDVLNIEFELEKAFDRVGVQVLNLEGKMLSERTLYDIHQETSTLDVSSLPTGTYIIGITTETGRRFLPFVVQR